MTEGAEQEHYSYIQERTTTTFVKTILFKKFKIIQKYKNLLHSSHSHSFFYILQYEHNQFSSYIVVEVKMKSLSFFFDNFPFNIVKVLVQNKLEW